MPALEVDSGAGFERADTVGRGFVEFTLVLDPFAGRGFAAAGAVDVEAIGRR